MVMRKQYILAHDLGTSGNKATLYDTDGNLVRSVTCAYELIVGEGNVAEQRADDWWYAVCNGTKELLSEIENRDVCAVSFSGQMMGCVCVDDQGTPLRNALIWADMRSTMQEEKLRNEIDDKIFYQITGHRLSSSYSITKLMWVRDNEPDLYAKTYRMLNAKDYIIYKLTGEFVTEFSDASSTCLLDLNTMDWSDTLLYASGLEREKLPTLLSSVEIAGRVTAQAASLTGLCEGTPVVCGGGDGCCAAVGTGVVKTGIANCCLGTSSWISLATKTPIFDEDMTTFNFAHIVPGYIMPCGTMQTGGGSLSWVVERLFGGVDGTLGDKKRIYEAVNREVSKSAAGAGKLLFLPYLMGERSPRWNAKARGDFVGLTMAHSRGDILRAVMEGVGYNLNIILESFKRSGSRMDELILIGGGARNESWQSILCDILNLTVKIPYDLESATSMGAAITAGVGVGVFDSFDVTERFVKIKNKHRPNYENCAIYNEMKLLFEDTYKQLYPIFENM